MAFYIKLYLLVALFSLVVVDAAPTTTTGLPLPTENPNLVKDGDFSKSSGSPWVYTGSIAGRRTGTKYIRQLGAGSITGYAELTIPSTKAIYPRFAQNITLTGDGYYTLNYQYTIDTFGTRQNCILQTSIGNASYSFTEVDFESIEAGEAVETYEAHYGFAGTYPLGLSFFLYCDYNPGVSMFFDNIVLRFNTNNG